MDHVDNVIEQWRCEKPHLNTQSMATVGRIKRLSLFFGREMEKTFKSFGLNAASFDMLATLLRSGPPYTLSPSELMASTMVTSGTMTNRIDQLEKAGLITRTQSESDKRSVMITLNEKGHSLINKAILSHVETLDGLTSMLSGTEAAILNNILKKMNVHFEC